MMRRHELAEHSLAKRSHACVVLKNAGQWVFFFKPVFLKKRYNVGNKASDLDIQTIALDKLMEVLEVVTYRRQ